MLDASATELCRRALEGWRQLAAHYDQMESALAQGELDVVEAVRRLQETEDALVPLLAPIAELRERDPIALSGEVRRMLSAIDALVPTLAARNASLLCTAVAARNACADRLASLSRRRATRARYAAAAAGGGGFASAVA